MEGLVTPENIATGLAVVGAGVLALFGVIRKAPPSKNIEVAGALIDSAQARNVVAALDRNTEATQALSAATRQLREEQERNTREMRELAVEIVRSKR